MYKLSVVIPVYNNENYLIQCLDSVVNQTFQDMEIIIVDDGSTDSSGKICDEYAKRNGNIKVIHNKNGGLGIAYNTGIKAAKGEYIGFIESDDFTEHNMYENLYSLATKYNADIVKSDWYSYTSENNQSEQRHILDKYPENTVINAKMYPDLLLVQASIWSAIYKKSFLQKYKIKFVESPGASYQDLSFTFKTISSAKKIIITRKPYVHYRIDNENSSIHSKGKAYAVCREFNEAENYIKKHPVIRKYSEDYKWIGQYYVYLWNLERLSDEHKSGFCNIFRETFSKALDRNKLTQVFFNSVDNEKFLSIIGRKEIIIYKSFWERLFSLAIKNIS